MKAAAIEELKRTKMFVGWIVSENGDQEVKDGGTERVDLIGMYLNLQVVVEGKEVVPGQDHQVDLVTGMVKDGTDDLLKDQRKGIMKGKHHQEK